MWLYCLLDPFIPTQIKFLATPLEMTKIKVRLVANPNSNPNPNSPIQSFHEFSSDFTYEVTGFEISDFVKSLISQIYCKIYTPVIYLGANAPTVIK